MSDVSQQVFSSQGGSYLLESRLQHIKTKLSEVNSAVRKLESNMIFLLVHPELVTYASQNSGSDSNEQQSDSPWSLHDEHSTVMSNPKVDYGQEQFMTNPNELSGQYSDYMGVRHDLMVNESEILGAIDEQKKHSYYDHTNENHEL